jgi:hypothetical protein
VQELFALASADRLADLMTAFGTQDTTQLKRAIDMTDDELVQIITRDRGEGIAC